MTVCADPKCQKHHGRYSSNASDDAYTKKWKTEQKARQEKEKAEENVRLKILDTIMGKIPADLSKEDLIFVATQFFDEIWDEYQNDILKRHEIKATKLQYGFDQQGPFEKYLESCSKIDLYKVLMEMALVRQSGVRHWTDKRKPDPLLAVAKRYKVKVKEIEAGLKAEAKAKTKEKAAGKSKKVQTSAKSKKAKK